MKRILIDGGYIEGGVYYFYLTDHLGNNRVVANSSGMVIQKTHYYPFGMAFAESTDQGKQPYKYNGKEFDQMHGLNLYDYSARYMEPALGRFTTVDPLAEKYPAWSPYSITFNNPIHFIDLDGQEPTPAEAARMAAHVYGDKIDDILKGGWQVSSRDFGVKLQDATGLKSLVYERVLNGKVVEYAYATAGTETNWKDLGADLKQPLGLSKQYASAASNAIALSKALGEAELSFVGHSLGGGEAALNALVTDRKAVTFNAAGVSDLTKFVEGTWKTPFKTESKIDAYIMTTDPLNNIQKNTVLPDVNGTQHYLLPTDGFSIYNGHSMDNVLKSFGIKKPEEYNKK